MNIPIFLAAGMAAELVLALIRPLRGATRGLVCWSVSAVVLSMCCAVYFISSGDITFDLPGAIRGIGGAGVLVLIAALIELFSPSRRSRQKPEQDPQSSERSLNIVLSVAAGILCAASLALSLFGERDTAEQADMLARLIRDFSIEPKQIQRKKYYVVYIKDGSMIVDLLNIMGAHVSLMDMENIRILKDMRNSVNRRVNCETANLNKVVSAAVKQMEDITYIEQTKGLKYLPERLREIASLRMEEPDTSLVELGKKLNPPLGKSGVNHRLKKISDIANELRRNQNDQ